MVLSRRNGVRGRFWQWALDSRELLGLGHQAAKRGDSLRARAAQPQRKLVSGCVVQEVAAQRLHQVVQLHASGVDPSGVPKQLGRVG